MRLRLRSVLIVAVALLALGCSRGKTEEAAASPADERPDTAAAEAPAEGTPAAEAPAEGTPAAETSADEATDPLRVPAAAQRDEAEPKPSEPAFETAEADGDATVHPDEADAVPARVALRLMAEPDWFAFARATADTTYLPDAFRRAGVDVPEGAYLYAARVLPGVEQPALAQYSLGTTGFEASLEDPWPASAVKSMAAIGALLSLREFGLDGTTVLRFDDAYGGFEGTVRDLIDEAIVPSDNAAYNRLMLIAGLDAFHEKHFRDDDGFPVLIQQRFYVKPDPSANFVVSPEIAWTAPDGRTGTIPARTSTGDYAACAREGNCVTLFELTEGLRRIALRDELPRRHRYRLTDADHDYLLQALVDTKCKYDEAVAEVLGISVDDLVDINKAGKVRGDDHLDHVLFVEPSGRRWFLAISVPYLERAEPDEVSQAKLDTLAKATMRALLDQPKARWSTPLQWPATTESDLVSATWTPSFALYALQSAPGSRLGWSNPIDGHRLIVYRNDAELGVLDGADARLDAPLEPGDTAVTVLEQADGTRVGYWAWRVVDS